MCSVAVRITRDALVMAQPGDEEGVETVRTVNTGDEFDVLEQRSIDGHAWVRIDGGWICLTGDTDLETDDVSRRRSR